MTRSRVLIGSDYGRTWTKIADFRRPNDDKGKPATGGLPNPPVAWAAASKAVAVRRYDGRHGTRSPRSSIACATLG